MNLFFFTQLPEFLFEGENEHFDRLFHSDIKTQKSQRAIFKPLQVDTASNYIGQRKGGIVII